MNATKQVARRPSGGTRCLTDTELYVRMRRTMRRLRALRASLPRRGALKRCVAGGALVPALFAAPIAARAQNFPQPINGAPAACQGGTGSAVTSVGTSAVTVCAAPTGTRLWWRIAAIAATATISGTVALECTDDGSTPSATNWTFIVYLLGYSTADSWFVSNQPIKCVAPGTTTITAFAAQQGRP